MSIHSHRTNGPLTALDPRLRLLLVPLLVACGFGSASLGSLAVVFAGVLFLWRGEGRPWTDLMRMVLRFRWLLLLTIGFHLVLTPGRTLFGTTWLSLDGLQAGMFIALQLTVAILCGTLLSAALPGDDLARGLAGLFRPLQRFGLPVQRWGELLVLVLQFVPVLRRQGEKIRQQMQAVSGERLQERIRRLVGSLDPAIQELADRADTRAYALAAGEGAAPAPLQRLVGWERLMLWLLVTGWLVLLCRGIL